MACRGKDFGGQAAPLYCTEGRLTTISSTLQSMMEGTTQQERFQGFVRTVVASEDLLLQENGALRAQVHDLTELLAGFDLCSVQEHLAAVRDRAYHRDTTPDRELLQVYLFERQLQQSAIESHWGKEHTPAERSDVLQPAEIKRTVVPRDQDVDRLQRRVEELERLVASFKLNATLTSSKSSRADKHFTSTADLEAGRQREQVEHLIADEEQAASREQHEQAMLTIRAQSEQIEELNDKVATLATRNATLETKCRRHRELVSRLQSIAN